MHDFAPQHEVTLEAVGELLADAELETITREQAITAALQSKIERDELEAIRSDLAAMTTTNGETLEAMRLALDESVSFATRELRVEVLELAHGAIDRLRGEPGAPGEAGPMGPMGPGLVSRGTWREAEGYLAGDLVMLGGSTFVALKDAAGPCPGGDWQLFAQRGKAGPPGAPGAPGAPGRAAAELTGAIADDEGILFEKSDGTVITVPWPPKLVGILNRFEAIA